MSEDKSEGKMNTDGTSELDQAKSALDQAREAHAAALLNTLDRPDDPQAQQRFQETVKAGRSAWKGYQTAATAGLAQQIEGIVPSVFRED